MGSTQIVTNKMILKSWDPFNLHPCGKSIWLWRWKGMGSTTSTERLRGNNISPKLCYNLDNSRLVIKSHDLETSILKSSSWIFLLIFKCNILTLQNFQFDTIIYIYIYICMYVCMYVSKLKRSSSNVLNILNIYGSNKNSFWFY